MYSIASGKRRVGHGRRRDASSESQFDYEHEHRVTEHEHDSHFVPERPPSPRTANVVSICKRAMPSFGGWHG